MLKKPLNFAVYSLYCSWTRALHAVAQHGGESLHPEDEARQGAGRAALFALRAGTSGDEPVAHHILLPHFAPIAADDLATMLADERKHLTCIAVRRRATLSVGWWPTEPGEAERHRRTRAEMVDALERQHAHPTQGQVILVGGDDRLTIPYPAFREFMLGYFLPFVDYGVRRGATTGSSPSQSFTVQLSPAAFDTIEIRRMP